MKAGRGLGWLGLVTAMLLSVDASAQDRPLPPRDRDGPDPQRMMSGARPTQFVPDEDTPRRRGMTPEERRQLRRDVHEAGRDLYPERMRERRREMRRGE